MNSSARVQGALAPPGAQGTGVQLQRLLTHPVVCKAPKLTRDLLSAQGQAPDEYQERHLEPCSSCSLHHSPYIIACAPDLKTSPKSVPPPWEILPLQSNQGFSKQAQETQRWQIVPFSLPWNFSKCAYSANHICKGKEVKFTPFNSQLLPWSSSRHQHARLSGWAGLRNGIKEGENNQQGSQLLFKCKYLWEEAIEGKEIMKTPVERTELGGRLISHAGPSAGQSLLHLLPKWETCFQKRFANDTHPSHP